MTSSTRRRLQLIAGILAASSLAITQVAEVGAAARPRPALFDLCDEECGPEVSCEQECWSWAPDLPLLESTCGEWSGPPWNGEGQCLGYCGDGFCNSFNNEEYGPEGCPEDCGQCGDEICDANNGENTATCYADCRECGDDICDGELFENCGTCATDCNPNAEECGSGEPGESCDEGKFNNAQGHCCVPSAASGQSSICNYCVTGEQCLYGWNPSVWSYVYMCIPQGEGCGAAPSQGAECRVP